mgnify:CR=1 FL=1
MWYTSYTLCRVAAPVCYLLYSSPLHHLEEYYTLLYSLDGCRVQTFVDCRVQTFEETVCRLAEQKFEASIFLVPLSASLIRPRK